MIGAPAYLSAAAHLTKRGISPRRAEPSRGPSHKGGTGHRIHEVELGLPRLRKAAYFEGGRDQKNPRQGSSEVTSARVNARRLCAGAMQKTFSGWPDGLPQAEDRQDLATGNDLHQARSLPSCKQMSPLREAPARLKSSIPEYCSNTTIAAIARISALHTFETSDHCFTVGPRRTLPVSSCVGWA